MPSDLAQKAGEIDYSVTWITLIDKTAQLNTNFIVLPYHCLPIILTRWWPNVSTTNMKHLCLQQQMTQLFNQLYHHLCQTGSPKWEKKNLRNITRQMKPLMPMYQVSSNACKLTRQSFILDLQPSRWRLGPQKFMSIISHLPQLNKRVGKCNMCSSARSTPFHSLPFHQVSHSL